ncbi:N-acetylmuramoyl-L-alanine amidase [Methylomonas sp. SURF-1]|uniref:N-acetylmuramoyl-L-alanine amidase n=1 Tax=Methylomonas aurea TaxID=2952224 RepID=A0ABT1UFE6_9GAMM|nr:N-acetylmuramoyl-L-alanine amidase [Methylomonas sp. SURF-1]MCQ8180588.1 N-acetylmuramoyl-L-alanine amidase [Methylomonas sp. SURF-1]
MQIDWIGCAADNFRPGRPGGFKPDAIVLHSVADLAQAETGYRSGGSFISTHYAIAGDGRVRQYVDEKDTAFHAGLVVNPSAALVQQRPNSNPNYYSIGIVLEVSPGQGFSAGQQAVCARLLREIADRWRIDLDAEHVLPHSAIRASAACPAKALNLAELLAAAEPEPESASLGGKQIGLLVNVKLRESPALNGALVKVVPAGSRVEISGFALGETVSGNSFWYRDLDGHFFWAGASERPNPRALLDSDPAGHSTDTMPQPAVVSAAPALAINRSRFRLPAGQYYSDRPHKDLIVLHFTAGSSAKSAFDTWNGDAGRIGAAYLVDVDGTVYEVFDPGQWAYHLGIQGSGGRHDKRSIAIEIANVGPLRPAADNPDILNWWPPKRGETVPFGTKYCEMSQTEKYRKQSYRGEHYFAAFPAVQTESIRLLLQDLCARFNIPRTLPPAAKQFERDPDFFQNYSGIACHVNFRQDKWDIGPAFDWPALQIPNARA